MVKKLIVHPILTDTEISSKEGYFIDNKDYKTVIDYDCDVYIDDGKKPLKLLLKFRKNVIPHDICEKAYNALEKASKVMRNNRGAGAGLLNSQKLPKYVKQIVKRDKYRIYYIGKDGKPAKTHLSNYVSSNIIGYYDLPDRNIFGKRHRGSKTIKRGTRKYPSIQCRTTSFNLKYPDKWNATIPLIKRIDTLFKKLLPDLHQKQLKQATLTPDFQIDNTAFSTATINYNYRTALHKDRGDYENGFGNLVVLEKSKSAKGGGGTYAGGLTGFYQYGIAVDVRQGDFLAMDVHQWHSNTEMNSVSTDDFGRLSVVCYLRKGMLKCIKSSIENDSKDNSNDIVQTNNSLSNILQNEGE